MEKTTLAITKTTLTLCLLCALSFAQIPKVAVYVSEQSGYSNEVKNALKVATMNVLVRGGKYEVVERSSVIDEELSKQNSGDVDDDQMVALGRQAGAKYVCVSDITDLGSYYVPAKYDSQGRMIRQSYSRHPHQVSARIIDVETAQLVGLGVVTEDVNDGPSMSAAITKALEKMMETISVQTNPGLPKKAVYVQGSWRNNQSANALYTYTLEALFTRSRYNGDFVVVERSEAFTRQIDRELGKQHSGSVADSEISRMGKQYGIAEICIASIESVMGTYNINARLVNVEKSSVTNASKLRHLKEGSAEARLELRNIAIDMVEDMIPRKITAAELEEEQRIEAKKAEEKRTAPIIGFGVGGGVSLNMNDIDPDYFKSLGGQFNLYLELSRQDIKFFRYGLNLDLGGLSVNRDEVRKNKPGVLTNDSNMTTGVTKINAFVSLYPADFLYLSGGAGWGFFSISSKEPKLGSDKLKEVDVSKISAPIFPIGGGIVLGSEEIGVAFVLEALYNIIPFKGRTAAYMSYNLRGIVYGRQVEEKKVREKI
ncbi:MAG: hypothetical protein LBC75_08125 [Fibromonadaceae bacterium]|jgi:hypothetical protein|nr:hypothetical protein [Fibromonadaceae bacterium]